MFSKYTNIEVPQNYSGSRFKKTNELHTDMKTHTPSEFSAVKSSVSPIYQEQIYAYTDESEVNECYEDDCADTEPCEGDETQKNVDPVDENCENDCLRVESNKATSRLGFDEIFKNFNSEDLLLVCLIIFLSTNESSNNNDIIILLSLLLAYHI